MTTLSDDVFNRVIGILADVGMDEMNVGNILKAVQEKDPELIKEFEDFL